MYPFGLPDLHEGLLDGRVLVIVCPRLDDAGAHVGKLSAVFEADDARSVTVAQMGRRAASGRWRS